MKNIEGLVYDHLEKSFTDFISFPMLGNFSEDIMKDLVASKIEGGLPVVIYKVNETRYSQRSADLEERDTVVPIEIYYCENSLRTQEFPHWTPDIYERFYQMMDKAIFSKPIESLTNFEKPFEILSVAPFINDMNGTVIRCTLELSGIDYDPYD